MPFLRTESPTTAHVFRCPRWRAVVCWVGVGVFLALTAALLLLLRRPVRVSALRVAAGAAFLVVLAVLSWRGLLATRDVVVLFDEGVVRRAPSGREQTARWEEVGAVRARPYRRRLELLDRAGVRLVALDYALDDFARLRRVVLERTAPFRPAPAAGRGVEP